MSTVQPGRVRISQDTEYWRSTLNIRCDSGRIELSLEIVYLQDLDITEEAVAIDLNATKGQLLWRDGRLHPFPGPAPYWYIDQWTPRVAWFEWIGAGDFRLEAADTFSGLGVRRAGRGLTLDFFASRAETTPSVVHENDAVTSRDWIPRHRGECVTARAFARCGDGHGAFLHWWRYPHGRDASWVLTDHADYDNADRLKAVFYGNGVPAQDATEGIAGSGLTCTKTVFVRASSDVPAEDLSMEKFRLLIEELDRAGIEIGLHTTSSREADREETRKDLSRLKALRPRVWIDHGAHNRQNLTREGADPESRFYVLDLLEAEGFRYWWSYIDVIANPVDGDLNLLTARPRPLLAFKAALSSLARLTGDPNARERAGYAVLDAVETLWGGATRSRPKFIWRYIRNQQGFELSRPERLRRAASHLVGLVFDLLDVRGLRRRAQKRKPWSASAPVFYRDPFRKGRDGDLWTFTTERVNDVNRLYRPENIDKLIEARGIHIGHTYLACRHPSTSEAPWMEESGSTRIHPVWAENLRHIRARVDEGRLWVPTLSGLGDHLVGVQAVAMEPDGPGRFRITYTGKRALPGMTFRWISPGGRRVRVDIDGRPCEQFRESEDGGCFWMDLEPGAEHRIALREVGKSD